MARFKLHDRTYSTAALDEISLKDLLLFNSQAEDLGLRRNWSDVERVSEELANLPVAEADRHPERFLVISTTIWAARRVAGEDVTLAEAVDFEIKAIEFIPDPQDHKSGKRKGAKKSAPKSRPQKASAPVDEAGDDSPASTSTSTD